jgi:hypothetical protein
MPKRQAAAGVATEGTRVATYEHGEEEAAEVATDLREGIQEMVVVNLLPSTVWALCHMGHSFPTIDNIELLRTEAQFWSLGGEKQTAVEAGDGHSPAVRAKSAGYCG